MDYVVEYSLRIGKDLYTVRLWYRLANTCDM